MSDIQIDFLIRYLRLADSKAGGVLLQLLHQADDKQQLHSTLDSLAEDCGVTKVTMNKLFQRLYKAGFLKKIRNGQYMLHPQLLAFEDETLMQKWSNLI